MSEWKQPHFFDALHPVLNVFEGLLVCDVVHQDDALTQSEERERDKRRGDFKESVKGTERAQSGSDVSLIIQSACSAGVLCSPWLLCSRLS